MLKLNQVEISFGKHLLSYNFKVDKGEILAVIGPSGGGKTTLLNLIAGFIRPDQGQIIYENIDITRFSAFERPVSYVFQEGNLFPHLSVKNNIALGINPNLSLNDQQTQLISQTLQIVGLANLQDKLPDQLSGGQKQKVAMGRALIRNRPIILLDEPFTGLDYEAKYDLINLIKSVHRKTSCIIILVTHDFQEVRLMASKVAIINNGLFELFEDVNQVLDNKQNSFKDFSHFDG